MEAVTQSPPFFRFSFVRIRNSASMPCCGNLHNWFWAVNSTRGGGRKRERAPCNNCTLKGPFRLCNKKIWRGQVAIYYLLSHTSSINGSIAQTIRSLSSIMMLDIQQLANVCVCFSFWKRRLCGRFCKLSAISPNWINQRRRKDTTPSSSSSSFGLVEAFFSSPPVSPNSFIP